MRDTQDEAREFWARKEEEKGGKVDFYTFATFLGMSDDSNAMLGGLLYTIDGKIYFEDFEKENWILKVIGRKQKWEKTEFTIKLDEIARVKVVPRGSALSCIGGRLNGEETKAASFVMRIFTKPVVQLLMKNGTSYFFEIMQLGDFMKAVQPPPD